MEPVRLSGYTLEMGLKPKSKLYCAWTETELSASLSERDRHTISVCFFRVVILLNKTVHLQLTKNPNRN